MPHRVPLARALLFWAFFLVFLIGAPAAVLGTAGYRLTFNNYRVRQTGTIALESFPRGASVTASGTPHNERTPTVLSPLNPGSVHLTLTRRGYLPWEGDAAVLAGKTTRVHALLLPDSAPVTATIPPTLPPSPLLPPEAQAVMSTHAVEAFAWDDESRRLVWSDGLAIVITDTEQGTEQFLTRLGSDVRALAWHPSGDGVLVADGRGIGLIELVGPTTFTRRDVAPLLATQLALTEDQKTLIARDDTGVFWEIAIRN